MAISSLFALIDDIATVLDDVAILTKVAAKKTAGVLGDDLALNAQQVAGVSPDRELPVVWAVAKGSALNKVILVPAALVLSAVAPWAVTPLLMLGGVFLCFEGFEKLAHRWLQPAAQDANDHRELLKALSDPKVDLVGFEALKIKGAIRTDLVLSAEIVAITLGAVAQASFLTQMGVLSAVAALMTIGVYGFVAAIVKLDDLGLYLSRGASGAAAGRMRQRLGLAILWAAPLLMKLLSIAGTAAMFLVGGGILMHGLPALHHALLALLPVAGAAENPAQTFLALALPALLDALLGVLAGALALGAVAGFKRANAWARIRTGK
ncbi:MAG: DUF808 domain-containing protein [Burkholderiales bacterium]|nr:DUF808 domain-containing protein [Burkholderiales bacterium]